VTYRSAPHATADDPSVYIDAERVEEARENECVGRYERYLLRAGVLTEELIQSVKEEALGLMREGIAQAEAEPPADPALVFEHAYANPPATLAHDLAELRRVLGG
jgi:pyruvate dehydrogenase E1 component alpha subunit